MQDTVVVTEVIQIYPESECSRIMVGDQKMHVRRLLFSLVIATSIVSVRSVQAEGGDVSAGERVFVRCKSCHTIEKSSAHKVGPNLFGVVGRQCGSTDFPRYSAGMKACSETGLVWSVSNLSKYIIDASRFLEDLTGKKGQGMTPQKLDDKQLSDILAYLSKFQ